MLRRAFVLIPAVLFALLISGCAPGQSDIENSIRDEMKSKQGIVITSFDLHKQADGSYVGTATAQNGDVYDISTATPKGGQIEWKADPGQAMVEKDVRQVLEQRLSTTVSSMQLTKTGPGSYTGPVQLASGAEQIVTTHLEGTQVIIAWEPKSAKH